MSTIIEHASAWVQTRTQGIFVIPASSGSGGAAKVGVDITPLNVIITPQKVGNKIELKFAVFGMSNSLSSATAIGFILKRNGSNLPSTTDGSDNYYAVNAVPFASGETATTTPSVTMVTLTDNNSLDSATTYTLAVRLTHSNSSTRNFYLNRSASAPASSAETGVSTTTITEYDL